MKKTEFTVTKQNNLDVVRYELKATDVYDDRVADKVAQASGIVTFQYSDDEGVRSITSYVKDGISLENMLKKILDKKAVLAIVSGIAGAFEVGTLGVPVSYIVKDTNYIYVNEENYITKCLLLPIKQDVMPMAELPKLFREILSKIRYDERDKDNYAAKLITLVNSDDFSVSKLKDLADKELEQIGYYVSKDSGLTDMNAGNAPMNNNSVKVNKLGVMNNMMGQSPQGMPGPMGMPGQPPMGQPAPQGMMGGRPPMPGTPQAMMGQPPQGQPRPMGMPGQPPQGQPRPMGMPGQPPQGQPGPMGMPGQPGPMGMPGQPPQGQPRPMGMPGQPPQGMPAPQGMPKPMGMPGQPPQGMPAPQGMPKPMGMPGQPPQGMPAPQGMPKPMGMPGQPPQGMPKPMGMPAPMPMPGMMPGAPAQVAPEKAPEPVIEDKKEEETSPFEEIKIEEPKVEEPKVEEPKVEEPKVEEPKVEAPKPMMPTPPVMPAAPTPVMPAVPKPAMPSMPNAAPTPNPAPAEFTMGSITGQLGSKPVPHIVRKNTGEAINITKPEFTIGKSKTKADYVIENNSAISRVHCIIVQKDGVNYIKDNNSTNHTYVNGVELEPGKEVLLKNKTVIQLGDEEFTFLLRKGE